VSETESVTLWLKQLKDGDRDSVRSLLERYLHRLVGLARVRLRGRQGLDGYEEDIALSAFKSLCLGVEKGRFPDLEDRDDLWRLLAVITIRKAIDVQRRKSTDRGYPSDDLEQFFSRDPSPEEAAEMVERVQQLLDELGADDLRQIAVWKVAGWSNDEIAVKLGCVVRSVERKLHRIRLRWREELPP
jgi:RNA polymerase sigma factor (sigma-70 family)